MHSLAAGLQKEEQRQQGDAEMKHKGGIQGGEEMSPPQDPQLLLHLGSGASPLTPAGSGKHSKLHEGRTGTTCRQLEKLKATGFTLRKRGVCRGFLQTAFPASTMALQPGSHPEFLPASPMAPGLPKAAPTHPRQS